MSNWKKVVRLLHCCLTRTLSENTKLQAQKGRLEADLLRTELELEETMALVSSLLAGQGPVLHVDQNIDGSTAAANVDDRQPHHVSSDPQASLDDASRAGSSTNHPGAKPKADVQVPANGDGFDDDQGSLAVNTSSTGSSTHHQGGKPAVGVPANGSDFDRYQGSVNGPPVKTYSAGSTRSAGGTLGGSPVVLSPVREGSEENLGSGQSETSWSALDSEDVASLATFKAFVTKHEASQALQKRDRVERTAATGRLTRSTAATTAPNMDRSTPPSRSPTMVRTAPRDAESSGDEDLSLRCSGSGSGRASYGSLSGSPRAPTPPAPAGPGIEMSYCLPGTAKNPLSARQQSTDTRSSWKPERNGLPGKRVHESGLAVEAPGARSTKPVGDEAKPAVRVGPVGLRAEIRHQSASATFAVGNPASSTATQGSDLLRGYPLAMRRATRAFDAAAALPAERCYPRRDFTARSQREELKAGPQTTATLQELDRTRRAIKKDRSDRLTAVAIEHLAAVAAVAQSSGSTAASKSRSRERQAACFDTDGRSARPLFGRQGARRPPSNLSFDAGYRMACFIDRFSAGHGGSIGGDTEGSAASTTVFAERGSRKKRVLKPSGVGRLASTRYDCGLGFDVKFRFSETYLLPGPRWYSSWRHPDEAARD